MAKACIIEREKKRVRLIEKYSTQRSKLKQDIKKAPNFFSKLQIYKKLDSLPKNSSPTRSRKRCWVTGRSRSCIRDFGLSRHALREMSQKALVPGLKKASW